MRLHTFIFLSFTLVLFLNACHTEKKKVKDNVLPIVESTKYKRFEMPRTQVISIQDTQAKREYELYIKLPEGYKENKNKKYPVLYFTDAIWHIEILSSSAEYLMENVILVGISWQKDIDEGLKKEEGIHVSRYRDYSIKESNNPEYQSKYQFGQADNHLAFIQNDVIPYVEDNYRTDPDNRSYFGYSLGGVFGAYVLLKQPDTFKNYILGSPSLKSNVSYLSEYAAKPSTNDKNQNTNVFISYGSLEEELGMYAEQFITMLKTRNDPDLSLKHIIVQGSHQTAFPLTGVHSITWLSEVVKE